MSQEPRSPGVRVEVRHRPGRSDSAGARILAEARRLLGAGRVEEIRVGRGFSLAFAGPPADPALRAARIRTVLVDPVLEEANLFADHDGVPAEPAGFARIDVVRRPGVMDPVAASVRRAFAAVGEPIVAARTYAIHWVKGDLRDEDLALLGEDLLANAVIEDVSVHPKVPVPAVPSTVSEPVHRREVKIREASDAQLERISRDGTLALNLEEMRTVQAHFRELRREPTDVELETLAQTWSEHCKHKTLTAQVRLKDRAYDNLLKDTIFAATAKLAKEECLSVFKDNAGAVTFDDEYAVTFKVETHNHPSALEPYGGAGTGIGGVIRDTLGTGLGAKPVLSTDVFCVGPLDAGHEDVPPGTLLPRRVLQGVVAGVRDYGNRMGIPTGNGAVFVHPDYRANPLVFAGSVGLIPRRFLQKAAKPGDRIYVLGGRTGRDGIHGATFSSEELDVERDAQSSGAVQIGNAIEEKRLLDAVLDGRDRGLFHAVTDCGAGGLSSAIGEMGEDVGAEVDLSKVPLKYEGLSAGEIWISEAQERMVVAVPPEKAAELERVCHVHQVEATDLGSFTGRGRLELRHGAVSVMDLSMEFVHDGLPRTVREAVEPARPAMRASPVGPIDHGARLLELLAHPDITSKEVICRQYDHEVLSGSVVKPQLGPFGYGPSDACVIAPRLGHLRGVVVGCGMSPTTGRLDPYQMALLSIDEAVRNVVSVGGEFERIALLDNFAWPSVQDAESLGAVVRACEACRDAALTLGLPFISGKDSLNNQKATKDGVLRIPPTLLISAMTRIDPVTRAVTMDLKAAGSTLVLVGSTGNELGGSRLAEVLGRSGDLVPEVKLVASRAVHRAVADLLAAGLAASCHDLSEGGLAVAAAEMVLASGIGARLELAKVRTHGEGPFDDAVLAFSESPTRYLLEVRAEHRAQALSALAGVPHAVVGETQAAPSLEIRGAGGASLAVLPVDAMTRSFRTGLGI